MRHEPALSPGIDADRRHEACRSHARDCPRPAVLVRTYTGFLALKTTNSVSASGSFSV